MVSLLRQMVLGAQVASVLECASNIDVEIRDKISRALNVKPIEVCPSSRCPTRRFRLYWLSWKLHAIDHYSVERAKWVDVLVFQPCEKGRRATAWISPGWVSHCRLAVATVCAALSARGAATDATGYAPCGHQALARWEEDSFKCPPYHYLWQNGFNAKTWRCPNANERERLLSFRPDHSGPALSTSAEAWEVENARLRLLGTAVHTGVLAYFFSVFFRSHQVPPAHQPVVTLVNNFSLASDDHCKPRSRHHQGSALRAESYRPRGAALGSFGAHQRCRAVVEKGKGLWTRVRVLPDQPQSGE